MRNLFIFFAIFSSVVLKNEAISIEMDCTFDGGKSAGDWVEFGWNLIEDGLSLIPEVGAILTFVDDITDFFGGDLEEVYFDRWKRCIVSWIRSEIDAAFQREASSNLNTMTIALKRLNETLEEMTSVDSEDDFHRYNQFQDDIRTDANDVKELVDASNGATSMMAPFKHAFYIELASMLLVGRRLLDMNATTSYIDRWKDDGISRMKTYRDFVDFFEKNSLKPYLGNWNVELKNHEECTAIFKPQFPLPVCEIDCLGAAYCEVTSSIQDFNNVTKNTLCICDIWPYTITCEGLCYLPDVNGCKGDFDLIRGECEATRDDLLEKETATKDNVNRIIDFVLDISTNAESVFGSIETGGVQYEW